MSVFAKFRGTIETLWQIGLGGPQVKNNAGALEARNAADAAFAVVRAAAPLAANDVAILSLCLTASWQDIAAGSTTGVNPGGLYAGDTTGARLTYNLPNTPADGSVCCIKNLGATVLFPVQIVPGAADACEDPQNQGSFGATAAAVFSPIVGAIVALKYQAAHNRWIGFVLT